MLRDRIFMKCVVCDGITFKTITNKLRNNMPRKVVQCVNCLQVSLENPSENAIDYSTSEYRESYSTVIGKKTSPKEEFDIKVQFQSKRIERMESLLTPQSKILEIGCSTGHFLYSVKDRVSEAVGIELFHEHAEFANEYCKVKVHEQPLDKAHLSTSYFDIICMFQVFEHIPNPVEFLQTCKKYLKPGGKIVLEVPNTNDTLLTIYNTPIFRERFYAAPHHYYYNTDTIVKMLKRGGFNGSARTVQDYTIYNHMHWLLTGKPMTTQTEGYRDLNLECLDSSKKEIAKILMEWFHKTNTEYKKLLEHLGVAEHVWYIGTSN